MSKVSHLPKNVPPKEIPFKIKVKGALNKNHTYEGDFVVRVPSSKEIGRVGLELARLNDGIPVEKLDRGTANLHSAIAYLRVNLITGPAWFVNTPEDEEEDGMDYGLETVDLNVPVEVFKAAKKKVDEWEAALKGQPKEAPSEPQKG